MAIGLTIMYLECLHNVNIKEIETLAEENIALIIFLVIFFTCFQTNFVVLVTLAAEPFISNFNTMGFVTDVIKCRTVTVIIRISL